MGLSEQQRVEEAQKALNEFQQYLREDLGVELQGAGIERALRDPNTGQVTQYLPPQGILQLALLPNWKDDNDDDESPAPHDPNGMAAEAVKRAAEEWVAKQNGNAEKEKAREPLWWRDHKNKRSRQRRRE